MHTLISYITAHGPKTDKEWADVFGTSRQHFCEIRNGTAQPGKALMQRIEEQTGGKVAVGSWFGVAA